MALSAGAGREIFTENETFHQILTSLQTIKVSKERQTKDRKELYLKIVDIFHDIDTMHISQMGEFP